MHRQGQAATAWSGLTAVVGAAMGLVPHVLHHVSFLAGAALVTGAGGNLVFGAVGLLFSVPLLLRLYRRFRTWKAPAVAVGVFAAMFSLSAFVIGPAISGDDDPAPGPVRAPGETVSPDEHEQHHDRPRPSGLGASLRGPSANLHRSTRVPFTSALESGR